MRAYEFLGQMFNYGQTYFEALAVFARLLLPLLGFRRERDTVDLAGLALTHHRLRDLGMQRMSLHEREAEPLAPLTKAGSGEPQDKHRMRIAEIVRAINNLFDGEVSEADAVTYVDRGKMMDNEALRAQAAANTPEQFANSPDLKDALMGAIMDALEAHQAMSSKALGTEAVRARILSTLLGPGKLCSALRGNGDGHYHGERAV